MTSRSDTLLALRPVTPESAFNSDVALTPLGDDRRPTVQSRRVIDEVYRQRTAMDAYTAKAHHAQQKISEVNQRGHSRFYEAAENMLMVKAHAQGTESEPYMQDFTKQVLQLTANHIEGVMRIHAAAQAQETARSPYPPEPEERPGFWRRLFGGG